MAKPTRTMASGQPKKKNAVGFDKTRNLHEKLHFAALPH
jgi:hypothetical protein